MHSSQPVHRSASTVCMYLAPPTMASTGQAWMHLVQPGLSGRCHRRRRQIHAYRVGRSVHRLRTVHPALSGGLHRPAASDEPCSCRSGVSRETRSKPAVGYPDHRHQTERAQLFQIMLSAAIRTVSASRLTPLLQHSGILRPQYSSSSSFGGNGGTVYFRPFARQSAIKASASARTIARVPSG